MQGDNLWKPRARTDRWLQAIVAQRDQLAWQRSSGTYFFYRPGRLLVDTARISQDSPEAAAVRRKLDEAGAHGIDDEHAGVAKRLGLELLGLDGRGGEVDLAREVRRLLPGSASLEHFLIADPHRYAGTDPAKPVRHPRNLEIPGASSAGEGLTVAVLDTGVWEKAGLPVSISGADDDEVLDEDGDARLDPPAGHGTFVAGIILRDAPGAKVIAHRVLKTPAGIASELEVAQALLALPEVDVINCSFGGPSQDDAAPLVIERALAQLPAKTVVVAAAGNQGESRPHWPAASKRAVAVAWVEGGKGREGWGLAEGSSRGPWVDACAPGTDIVSSFVSFSETGLATAAEPLRDFDGWAAWSGTSFATPAVTGAILALASRDGIPVKEAVYRLIDHPDRLRIPDAGTLVVPNHLPPAP